MFEHSPQKLPKNTISQCGSIQHLLVFPMTSFEADGFWFWTPNYNTERVVFGTILRRELYATTPMPRSWWTFESAGLTSYLDSLAQNGSTPGRVAWAFAMTSRARGKVAVVLFHTFHCHFALSRVRSLSRPTTPAPRQPTPPAPRQPEARPITRQRWISS